MTSEPADLAIKVVLEAAIHELEGSVDTPQLEAELLLAHSLHQTRSHLRAWPERPLTATQKTDFDDLILRRLKGEPVAYITGWREFWSLSLQVTPQVLIPRADTELLVERALEHLADQPQPWIADLGTGSGAIALALASEQPSAHIVATDLSPGALEVARNNARRLDLTRVEFFAGNWLQALPDIRFDIIVSNPPYIATNDPHLAQGDLPAEPQQALRSGIDGLDDLRLIVADAPQKLRPGGWLLLEHGYNQGAAVRNLLRDHRYGKIKTISDLEGRERVTEAVCPEDVQTTHGF